MKKGFIAVITFLLCLFAQTNIFQVHAMESSLAGSRRPMEFDLILSGDTVTQISIGGDSSGALLKMEMCSPGGTR
ncbi:MAG: hypothetical protein MZV70_11120 [Desulfobacterales bacterium]|nr:hypothetical protein [Desulfobacterales bacterium]